MQVDLTGRVAIVTGSTRGIGRGIALALAANGARVVVNGRSAEAAAEVAHQIVESGGAARDHAGDLAVPETLDGLVDAASALGGLDILVNNAGLTDTFGAFLETPDERTDEILAVNLRAAMVLCRRAARSMAQRRRGAIVNVTSVGGSQRAHHDNVAYDTTKGGLDALTRALAVDLGPLGIRVNAVGPAATSDAPPEGRGGDLPLRRGGTPGDVANAVLYLVSDEAAFVTGQILYIDGGLSAQLRSPAEALSSQNEIVRD